MLNVKNLAIAILLFSTSLLPMTTNAKNATAEWCEEQWSIESAKAVDQDTPDYAGLLNRWKQHGKQCAGTVAYEARLATAYVFLKQFDNAKNVLTPLMQTRSEYRYLVDFSLLQIDYFAKLVYGKGAMEDVRHIEEKYRIFVKQYPDFPDGYGLLGGLQTLLGKHVEAIKSLEIGLHSSMDVSGVYSNLTISYTAVGRYKDAINAADKAYGLKKSVTSDQYFIYALAKSNAGVGNFHSAETALRVIAAKKPEVRRDPEFKEAVDFVTAKMDANKKPNGSASD